MNPITMQLVADKYIKMALEEDINSEDVSTNAVMPEYKKGKVQLICKEDGIIAGLMVFERVFTLLDSDTQVTCHVKDGDEVKKGEVLAVVRRYPRAALRRAHRAELLAAHERHSDLYAQRGQTFRGNENDAS